MVDGPHRGLSRSWDGDADQGGDVPRDELPPHRRAQYAPQNGPRLVDRPFRRDLAATAARGTASGALASGVLALRAALASLSEPPWRLGAQGAAFQEARGDSVAPEI